MIQIQVLDGFPLTVIVRYCSYLLSCIDELPELEVEVGVVLPALADQLPVVPLVVAGAGLDHAHPGRGARHQGGHRQDHQGLHDHGQGWRRGRWWSVLAEELRCVTSLAVSSVCQ